MKKKRSVGNKSRERVLHYKKTGKQTTETGLQRKEDTVREKQQQKKHPIQQMSVKVGEVM